MEFTIAQLAKAVGKDQGYVRQHVFRGHLKTQKRGRMQYIDLDEAARWALERRLEFDARILHSKSSESVPKRAARITVLSLHESNGRLTNLFTLVRHRREDSLGPWAIPNVEHWSSEDLTNGLRLFSLDRPLARIDKLIEQIKHESVLEVDDLQIDYSLSPMPQNYWAYRDQRSTIDASIQSPFSRHSASVTEYWCLNNELIDRWEELQADSKGDMQETLKNLGFPLHRHADRIGNLMIAGAEDAITCDLLRGPGQSLRFVVDAEAFTSDTYYTSVWGTFCGTEVMRRTSEANTPHTPIQFPSTVDRIGFAVHRISDGQCVDWMDTNLIVEIRGSKELDSRQTFHIQRPKQGSSQSFGLRRKTASLNVRTFDDTPEMDQRIRRRWLNNNYIQQEKKARKEGNVHRFKPQERLKALEHLVQLMRSNSSNRNEPIYLADPHFELHSNTRKPENDDLVQALVDLFSNAYPRTLRILCTGRWDSSEQPWWATQPIDLTEHVSVRTFNREDPKDATKLIRAFHDRYLITPDGEFAITNSLNGWSKHGTTFVRLSTGVYRAEAEKLWSMNLRSNSERWFVQEIS